MAAPPVLVGTVRGPRITLRVAFPSGHSPGRRRIRRAPAPRRDMRAPDSSGGRGRLRPRHRPTRPPTPPVPVARPRLTGTVAVGGARAKPVPIPTPVRRVVPPKGSVTPLNGVGCRARRDRVTRPAPGRPHPRYAGPAGSGPVPTSGAYLRPVVGPREPSPSTVRVVPARHLRLIEEMGGAPLY